LVLISLALAACAPRVQEAGPVPGAPRLDDGLVVADDGHRLPLRVWPVNPDLKAVIVAVHGFNDYSNAFAGPATWWAERGVATYAYDQRGFGASAEAGIWGGAERMSRDLGNAVAAVRRRHPEVPLYVLATSMGGAVTVLALAEGFVKKVDGVILSAPALWGGDTLNPVYRGALWLAAHTLPFNKATGRDLGIQASDNIEMLRALGRDPLVIKETRIDALYGLVELMDRALAAANRVEAFLLVLYGAREEVVPEDAARTLLKRLPIPYRLAVYPEGWHMLLRDLQAEIVWRDVLAWIEDRDVTLPSGAERAALPPFVKR
jgi:alpha-beta hydrolase superfamily lysophospholipase